MPEIQQAREVLVVRGTIDESGRFTPRRCGSTFHVRRWPAVQQSPYVVELLDRDGRVVHRVLAPVERVSTCDVLDTERFRLTAYIGLRDEAAVVRLRKDDVVLWQREIPAAATVDVRLAFDDVRREQGAVLRLECSPHGDGAYVMVVYQWGRRRFQTVEIADPQAEYTIDLRGVAGGNACRFVVIYSNGLRSASAATKEFALDLLGPTVTIVQPPADSTVHTGQHLVLQGYAVDSEREGGANLEQLTWHVDGEAVRSGPIAGIDDLAEGEHHVVLRYGVDPPAEAEVVVRVRASAVATAEQWQEFNRFQ